VLVVDREGRVVEFNGAAEEIFGYGRAEAVGAKMEDLIIPDHLKAAHEAGMNRYLTTGERRVIGKGRVQLEARRKDGSLFPVELSISSPSRTWRAFRVLRPRHLAPRGGRAGADQGP
jgi:PAS domain S-box-containing protein